MSGPAVGHAAVDLDDSRTQDHGASPSRASPSIERVYRPEIDGLRAIAVLAVMLFHAGFETFSGGYVGVDIFFVISGYLITGIVVDELAVGRFSFLAFIERRARRILPALFLVLLVGFPVAWLWSTPLDMRSFSAALLSVVGFVSNIWFWRNNGYFDLQADFNPLLHTWSLAVEEQYYVVFPLLLCGLWRLRARVVIIALVLLGLASLALAEWGAHHKPTANFYLLPTRGWEFLIGALLAIYRRQLSSINRVVVSESAAPIGAQLLPLVGIALIAYAVLVFDAQTPFPGLAALVPTIGAALLIDQAHPRTWIGRLLASRLLVGIGLISYSAYLWHQPILAFARQRALEPPDNHLLLGLLVLSLGLAWLSWKLVETPWRDSRRTSRRRLVAAAVVCAVGLAAFGTAGVASHGFPGRLSPAERELMAYANYDFGPIYGPAECFLRTEQTWRDFGKSCSDSNPGATLLWGDSHAAALSHGLRQVLGTVHQYSASGCPALVGVNRRSFPNCMAINEHVIAEVARLKPGRVILHADWLLHDDLQPARRLPETLERIRGVSPASRIIIVGPVPQWHGSLPATMLKQGIGLQPDQLLAPPNYGELAAMDQALQALAQKSGVDFRSSLQALCSGERCPVTLLDKGQVTLSAWDHGHLTAAGSERLARRLELLE